NVRRQAEPNRRRAAETMPALPRRGPRSRQSSRLQRAKASRRRQDSEGRGGQRLSCGHLHTGESSSYTTCGRADHPTREKKVGQPDITEYESGAPTSASPGCEYDYCRYTPCALPPIAWVPFRCLLSKKRPVSLERIPTTPKVIAILLPRRGAFPGFCGVFVVHARDEKGTANRRFPFDLLMVAPRERPPVVRCRSACRSLVASTSRPRPSPGPSWPDSPRVERSLGIVRSDAPLIGKSALDEIATGHIPMNRERAPAGQPYAGIRTVSVTRLRDEHSSDRGRPGLASVTLKCSSSNTQAVAPRT